MYLSKIPKIYLYFLIAFYTIWIIYVFFINDQIFDFFKCWPVALTMVFGSFVAGSSAAGGGSVAYPVLTLVLDADASVARDFSLAIQSIGMTAATLFIIGSKIKVEKNAILFGSIGGVLGFFIGSNLYHFIPESNLKLIFTSIWLSFGFALWLVNKNKERTTTDLISKINFYDKIKLIIFGGIGGCITSFFGSGIDIMIFCLLTLHFSLSEKIATPTSVILMTINTLIGFFYHLFYIQDIQTITISYWVAASPVVALGAPFGAFVINKLSRKSIARFLYFILILQFIGTIYIAKNEIAESTFLLILSVLFLSSIIFYFLIKTSKK